MQENPVHRRLAAVLAADVAGYSGMIGNDEEGTIRTLRTVWVERFNPAVTENRGRLVKMMGDGALVEFSSAVDAVRCALAIQSAMAQFNAGRDGAVPVEFRIGINLGDIVIEGGDIFGDGVNIAARLESLAPRGGVLISDAVHLQVRGKVGAFFADAGELQLKNIAVPVRAWRWGGSEPAADSAAAGPAATASVLADLPSIAVLPFTVMSGDSEQDYFADGLVEDLITTLSKISGLRVIARNSTFTYKGRAVDIRTVARELGVRYVLEGSIRKSGNRIRISGQLIDAADGTHVWAERYDRSMEDIFTLQDEITLVLATEMQVKLTEGEQARLHYTTTSNVEAWTLWVQGLYHFRKAVTRDSTAAALASWLKALALDPDSSALNAMVGFIHYIDARFGWWDDFQTATGKALLFAGRALELDPENPDAHLTHGFAMLLHGNYAEAASHAHRAAALAPSSADVASFACFCLAFAGYPLEAVVLGERSLTLSPFSPPFYFGHLGNAYRLASQFEPAIACFRTYHQRIAGFGLVDLVLAFHETGRIEDARSAARELMAIRRDFTIAGWARTQFRADKARFETDRAALAACGLPPG